MILNNRIELSIMMFLEFFIWGSWFVTLGTFLGKNLLADGSQSAAQGLITLATYGVGMLIGFWVAGFVSDAYKLSDSSHDWEKIWMVAAGIAAAVAVLFVITFNQNKEAALRHAEEIT